MNGKVVKKLGAKADPDSDTIEVDGQRITETGEKKVYILLNKPRGTISSVKDQFKRPVVTSLLRGVKERVYPVGRLDYDSEGVLLLTNDGDLANRLTHPTSKVPKKYLVKVKDVPSKEDLEKLEKGVRLEDGRTHPARAKLVRETKENSWVEVTVTEGRTHLVKRMMKAVGHPVSKLKRVEFAGVGLGRLRPGHFRRLTDKEVRRLKGL